MRRTWSWLRRTKASRRTKRKTDSREILTKSWRGLMMMNLREKWSILAPKEQWGLKLMTTKIIINKDITDIKRLETMTMIMKAQLVVYLPILLSSKLVSWKLNRRRKDRKWHKDHLRSYLTVMKLTISLLQSKTKLLRTRTFLRDYKPKWQSKTFVKLNFFRRLEENFEGDINYDIAQETEWVLQRL